MFFSTWGTQDDDGQRQWSLADSVITQAENGHEGHVALDMAVSSRVRDQPQHKEPCCSVESWNEEGTAITPCPADHRDLRPGSESEASIPQIQNYNFPLFLQKL